MGFSKNPKKGEAGTSIYKKEDEGPQGTPIYLNKIQKFALHIYIPIDLSIGVVSPDPNPANPFNLFPSLQIYSLFNERHVVDHCTNNGHQL